MCAESKKFQQLEKQFESAFGSMTLTRNVSQNNQQHHQANQNQNRFADVSSNTFITFLENMHICLPQYFVALYQV